MTIVTDELVSLVPITALALVYVFTDITTFNRLRTERGCIRLTRVQVTVLLLFYPVWIFLLWIETLSTKRGNVSIMTFVGSVNTVVGWATTIYIFNDDFTASRQQYSSLVGRLILNALWRWNNYLVYADDDSGSGELITVVE